MAALATDFSVNEEESEELVRSMFLKVTSVPLPAMEPTINWPETFSLSPSHNNEAHNLLLSLQSRRETVMNELTNPNIVLSTAIAAVESYLPEINLLLESLNSQSSVAIKKVMRFSWTGGFGGIRQVNSAIIYEVAMLEHSLAVLHYRQGCSLVSRTNDNESIKTAAKSFLSAASVLIHLGDKVLPRWTTRSSETREVPELSSQICYGFADLCVCSAQQCVVVQGLRNGTAHGTVAKLCSAVSKSSDDSLLSMSSDKDAYQFISHSILEQLSFTKAVFSALAYMYEGKAKSSGGSAVANFRSASAALFQQGSKGSQARHNPLQPGLPNLRSSTQHASSISSVEILLATLRELLDTADRDNKLIYFELEPEVAIPTPILLANVTSAPYTPTPIGRIVAFFIANDMQSTTAKNETENNAILETVFHEKLNFTDDDEELARKLQRQYDEEN
jgi:hypothetical protein